MARVEVSAIRPFPVRLVARATADNQAIMNSITALPSTGAVSVTNAELLALLSEFRTRWEAQIIPLLHESYTIVDYIVLEIIGSFYDNADPAPIQDSAWVGSGLHSVPAVPPTGGKTGAPLPTFVGVRARGFTASFSRYYHPSTRFGPILESESIYNILDPTVQVAWSSAWSAVCQPYVITVPPAGAITWTVGAFSPSRMTFLGDGTSGSVPFQALTGTSVDSKLASQVSRRVRSLGA